VFSGSAGEGLEAALQTILNSAPDFRHVRHGSQQAESPTEAPRGDPTERNAMNSRARSR